jgi:hypothetical protein
MPSLLSPRPCAVQVAACRCQRRQPAGACAVAHVVRDACSQQLVEHEGSLILVRSAARLSDVTPRAAARVSGIARARCGAATALACIKHSVMALDGGSPRIADWQRSYIARQSRHVPHLSAMRVHNSKSWRLVNAPDAREMDSTSTATVRGDAVARASVMPLTGGLIRPHVCSCRSHRWRSQRHTHTHTHTHTHSPAAPVRMCVRALTAMTVDNVVDAGHSVVSVMVRRHASTPIQFLQRCEPGQASKTGRACRTRQKRGWQTRTVSARRT